jgi:hypothetical protein
VEPAAGRRAFEDELHAGVKGQAEVVIGRGPWPLAEGAPDLARPGRADRLAAAPARSGGDEAVEHVHRLDIARDLYLEDHRLDGKPVLPAAMAAELMSALVARTWPEWQVVGMRGFRLLRGIVLSNGPRPIRLVARPHPRNGGPPHERAVDVEIAEVGAGPVAYRGTVVLGPALPDAPGYTLPPSESFARFPMDPAAAYREFLFHGPRFQCITSLGGIAQTGIIATVRPSRPAECLSEPQDGPWVIDPVALDAGPQLAMIWSRALHRTSALPSRFAMLRRFRAFEPSVEGRCHFQVLPQSTPETIVSNVYYVGTDGRLILALEGLESTCSQALNRLSASSAR